MVNVRERFISEDEIQKRITSPEILEVKKGLNLLADELKAQEEHGKEPASDDDEHMQRPSMRTKPKGPLSGHDNNKRVEASEENTNRILRELGERRGVQMPGLHDHDDEDKENDKEELPLPRMRREFITNREDNTRTREKEFQPPPTLSEIQKLRLDMEAMQKENRDLHAGKAVPQTIPDKGKLRFAKKPDKLMEGGQAVGLLSDFIFYDFAPSDFTVKPIDIHAQMAITAAKTADDGNGDLSLLFDAMQMTINPAIDLRLLTYPDVYYLCYYLQFNSYPSVPFNIKWISKYGNKNLFSLENHNLRYLRPRATQEDLARWKELGLDYPRLRDWEILNIFDLEPEDRKVYERAQYFQGNTPEEKVETMYARCAKSVAPLLEIPKMMDLCNHGVFDHVDLIDVFFDPVVWREKLLERGIALQERAEKFKEDSDNYDDFIGESKRLFDEAATIQNSLMNKERVVPDAERVTLVFSPLAFFSVL